MSTHQGDWVAQVAVLVVLAFVLLLCLLLFLAAGPIERVTGPTLTNVISRLLGVVLGALAVEYIFDGIRNGLLAGAA